MRQLILIVVAVLAVQVSNGQTSPYGKKVDSLTQLAYTYLYTVKDSAFYYFDEISQLARQEEDWKSLLETGISVNRIAGYHYDLEKMRTNIRAMDSLLTAKSTFFSKVPEHHFYQNSLLYDQGAYYFEVDNFKQSRDFFEQLINNTEDIRDTIYLAEQRDLLSTAYSFMAKMYANESKYDLAKQYYNRNIRLISEVKPDDKASLHINYSLLAEVFRKEGAFTKSNEYFTPALDFYLQNNGNTNTKVSIAQNIIQNHLNLSQQDSAQYYLTLMQKQLPENHPFWNRYYAIEGDFYATNKTPEKAEESYMRSLELYQQKWGNQKHEEVAKAHNKLGLLFMDAHQPQKALAQLNLGLEQLIVQDIASPTLLRLNSSGATALSLLKNKAEALTTQGNMEAYKQVLETVNQGIALVDELKPGFKSEADKLLLIEEAIPLFESGMEAAFYLYENSGDEKYINLAFLYSEKSKSVLLLEVLLGTKASAFAKIPDSILERERQLKSLIADTEKRLNRAKKASPTAENKLFALKSELRELSKTIESSYPSYFNLKYDTNVVSLDQVQGGLKNGPLLLSYFYGSRAVYLLGVAGEAKDMYRIPLKEDLAALIRNVQVGLSTTELSKKELGELTYVLFHTLVAPALEAHTLEKGLLILPDGLLNYIPFGALNTKAEGLKYLIETTPISYSNSATLLAQLNERKFKSSEVLGFAPSFPENTQIQEANLLLPLPHNHSEVSEVLTSFKGDSYIGTDASLENFKREFSNYGMLHLATHAIYDDGTPEYSYLAFTPKSGEDYLLYVRDLYQLELDAALVTLSACESGIGELKGGEGLMGMARGFFYGGASSIASTLWKINDASSAKLMGDFYKNLAEGQAKDIALQNSKLSFLKTNAQNALSHPYYWSAYILSGNTDTIPSSSKIMWYLCGVLLIIILGVIFRKKLIQRTK